MCAYDSVDSRCEIYARGVSDPSMQASRASMHDCEMKSRRKRKRNVDASAVGMVRCGDAIGAVVVVL